MMITFYQGQRIDGDQFVDLTVAIDPDSVATVERNRSPYWSVITLKDRREHSVEGDVAAVTRVINNARVRPDLRFTGPQEPNRRSA